MSTNEYREALIALYQSLEGCNVQPFCREAVDEYNSAVRKVAALLARREPEPVISYDEFWRRVRETGWNPTPEELTAQLYSHVHQKPASNGWVDLSNEPSPRITREEAERLIDDHRKSVGHMGSGTKESVARKALFAAMGVDHEAP